MVAKVQRNFDQWIQSASSGCQSLCSNLKRVSSSESMKGDRTVKIELTKMYYTCKQFIDYLDKSKKNFNSICQKRKRESSSVPEDTGRKNESSKNRLAAEKSKSTRSVSPAAKRIKTVESDQAVTKLKSTSQIQKESKGNKSFRLPSKENSDQEFCGVRKRLFENALSPIKVSTPQHSAQESRSRPPYPPPTPYRIPKIRKNWSNSESERTFFTTPFDSRLNLNVMMYQGQCCPVKTL